MVGASSRVFAILGSPVAHSLSPTMHNAAFRALGLDAVYIALRCDPGQVEHLIRAIGAAGGGGNVTVPHKETAVSAIDRPSDAMRRVGACNTFWGEHGATAGDNTDIEGLNVALQDLDAPATAWLVAGTGGGARAVVGAAREKGVAIAVRSRDPERRRKFEEWTRASGVTVTAPASCEVLINTTPLGLTYTDHLPIALDEAPGACVALDMVYQRGETVWTRSMRQSGLRAADGRGLLVAQGAAAFQRWFPAESPPIDIMRAAVDDALR
ncbi:MAG: shikimate dehydrogenase [Gemmatimonadota bacterium]